MKNKLVNISYSLAAGYLVDNYMHNIRVPLKVLAYPVAKKKTTPSNIADPVHWKFLVHSLFDVEMVSAGGDIENKSIVKSMAVADVLRKMPKSSSYTNAVALFIEQIAKTHKFNTSGLWCINTPTLERFIELYSYMLTPET